MRRELTAEYSENTEGDFLQEETKVAKTRLRLVMAGGEGAHELS
jgi:hypothetical protein